MTASAIDEVRRFHIFVEQWLSGTSNAETGWRLFEDSLAETFEMVVPQGPSVPREQLLKSFASARGSRPGVRVEIRNERVLYESADLCLVRYEEWQLHEESSNQRVSTALFARSSEAPLGWSWLAVHETWLPLA